MAAFWSRTAPAGNGASVSFATARGPARLQSDAVSLSWLSQGMADAPVDDAWLSPRESAWIARMRFPKRRSEFRLGRWTAKKALALYLGRDASSAALGSIEIDRAPDGAPLPLVEGRPAEAYVTMTDRADQAVCLVGPPGTALGCDLELVEPRSDGFVSDFLTAAEQGLVGVGRPRRRARPPRQPGLVRQGVGAQGPAHRPAPRHAQRRGVVSRRRDRRGLGADERPRGRGSGLPGLVAALRRVRADGGRDAALRPAAAPRRPARPRHRAAGRVLAGGPFILRVARQDDERGGCWRKVMPDSTMSRR